MHHASDFMRLFYSEKQWLIAGTFLFALVCAGTGHAAHEAVADDLVLPLENAEVVERGSSLFSEKCSACHGGEGRGGRAPCLTCGKFARSGNSNAGIYATIVMGIPMTKMGGFGSSVPAEDILSVVTYLRWKEHERVDSGEIAPRSLEPEKPLAFPNADNSY